MKSKFLPVVFFLSGSMLFACSPTSQPTLPTKTPAPIITIQPVSTHTPRPSPTSVTEYFGNIGGESVNIRGGPGTNYDVVTSLAKGTELRIIGRDEDCTWLVVDLQDGGTGWIRADLIVFSFSCDLVDIHAIPPTPTAKPYIQPTSAGCDGETVQVSILNNTGGAVSLTLRGPCSYTFYLPTGNSSITVLPGSYSYTAYGCGGATSTGTRSMDGSVEWTWFCE
ncbi:MAG: hypothetical protein A2X25_06220 [Chloroflexi bacterium GWB2_49_20]|nr:MAG: hypothetical protein A2X25_06220 [Chloroflexi bacterium GWB2_49_20]OGN77213.1 MAG: hypothetical protein A2X26_07220 [Chloroflexi bacterium GWC2_49_37]OGN83939.1 MAG: hypothetical protein A2X27_02825 [Chloroflexi bacterium GWD2_49_16]